LFEEARRGLFARLQENCNDVETLRLLAQVEEALLNYSAAVAYLKQAIALTGQASKKDLKKLSQYESLAREWKALGLTPAELEALGFYLKETTAAAVKARTGRTAGCDSRTA
jgi:hypothetical protein